MACFDGRYTMAAPPTRLPSPPRLTVPALNTDKISQPSHNIPYFDQSRFNSSHSSPQAQSPQPDSEPGRREATISTRAHTEWMYDSRRTAQQILDNVYLGPTSSAKDISFLQREGITLLLGLRQINPHTTSFAPSAPDNVLHVPSPASVQHAAEASGIQNISLGLASIADLPRTIAFSNRVLSEHLLAQPGKDNKVLLHCESGNERSAALCAAYMMANLEGVDWIRAVQLVQAQRFCANFDDGIKRCLQAYGDLLMAQREVAASSPGMAPRHYGMGMELVGGQAAGGAQDGLVKRGKRGREVEEDEDMDMGGAEEGDGERFDGRAGFAPFIEEAVDTSF